ncbi:Alpha/Beta hydrolase protein [Coniella lustricola]|uniref:Carboxypeptidase n=1 Tax=Coniella lustricola TaxID=2025994 RepID=A0A2T3AK27_9PEZI|nr:Alpha/Beta hydrolase protein [Coniella lustricola]
MYPRPFLLTVLATLASLSTAQFPPPREGITWFHSQHHPDIHISYKDPHICETTPGVKSYSGYVHLPPHTIYNETEAHTDAASHAAQPYPINTFFWFVEARKDPHHAPLSIWLNGGPGGSSMLGMLSEHGPCMINADSNSSRLNPWAWNNEVNMLFIDQPVQVGFSYDTLHNGTLELLVQQAIEDGLPDGDDDNAGIPTPIKLRDDFEEGVPEQNATFYVGTFASQNVSLVPNSSEHAAVALWHFAQTWFDEFPQYKPHDEKISLWTESYGGHYGPAFMHFFARQNDKITRGEIAGPGTHYLHLDTLGIINGCIDNALSSASYSAMANNNTYGVQAVNETILHNQLWELHRAGGILDQVAKCQRLDKLQHSSLSSVASEQPDPAYVEAVCRNATNIAMSVLIQPYMESQAHGWFDITHPANDPFPHNYLLGYLQQQWVQRALGVPVNFTWSSPAVSAAFQLHGDLARGGQLDALADLLDAGIKVHLMYGDRDFACNWIGGEAASLAIPHRYQKEFAEAGYTALTVGNDHHDNDADLQPPFVPYGLTRQHGNLSFTRVFQAGHMVPSYQPEASLRIFERSLFNRDIATGSVDLTRTGGWAGADEGSEHGHDDSAAKTPVFATPVFATKGYKDTWWRKNEVFGVPKPQCYILQPWTCSEEETEALKKGTAVVREYLLVDIVGKGEDENEEVVVTTVGGTPGEAGEQAVLGVDEL